MKVLYILSSTTVFGGGSKSFLDMLHGLVRLGVRPIVVFPMAGGLQNVLINEGIQTFVTQHQYRMAVYPPTTVLKDIVLFVPRLFGRIYMNRKATAEVVALYRDFKPDIIHTNVSVIDIGFRAAQQLHIPHIWHIREYGDKDFSFFYYPIKKIQLLKYKKKSYTITITKDIAKYNSLINDKSSIVIYNGIASKYDLLFIEDKKPYFLYAGRIEPCKGLLDLVEAYGAFLKKTNSVLDLIVAGSISDGTYNDIVNAKVEQLQITNRIHFLGAVGDIKELYKRATATIVPSLSEGFGRVMPEAMFCGSLVIGRDVAGTKEQFDNAVELTGQEIGLRYSTHEGLVQILCDVERNGVNYYTPMIKRAQDVVAQLYSVEKCAENVYSFYKNILNG